MEGISRKDIDTACDELRTIGKIELADKIQKYDIIPKLYAYAYFKSVDNILKELKGEGKTIDREDLEATLDQHGKLQLDFLLDSAFNSNVKKLTQFLHNGFDREDKFCDFDDSKFHNEKRFGKCQCEDHQMDDEDKEKEQELSAVYMPDEFTYKYEDDPEWWCRDCADQLDGGDCDVEVSCDMDMEL